jgi:hypothetical protein
MTPRFAGDPVCAGVPGGDESIRVEHEDRVFLDRLYEEAELFLTLADELISLAALGEVAGHLRETDQLRRIRSQGGNDGVAPESAAVLSDAPSLVFDAPFLCGDLELAPRFPVGQIAVTVKPGEVLADDLVRVVAHDPRGAAVP